MSARFGGKTAENPSVAGWGKPAAAGVTVPNAIEYLIVAGGGAGGRGDGATYFGGGGGAGGYRSSVVGETSGGGASAEVRMTVDAGITYTITIGAGGGLYASGGNSSIAGTDLVTLTSLGGGLGAGTSGGPSSGGSGGGGRLNVNPESGTTGQGYRGGFADGGGGGGGGAAAVGGNGSGLTGGTAGTGRASSITGSSVTRSTGGLGGDQGGTGGANTGNGGGGGNVAGGSAGGSGVVIVRHLISFLPATILTVGTMTSTATHYIYTFNATGTIGWTA